jgi:hypothetical protein
MKKQDEILQAYEHSRAIMMAQLDEIDRNRKVYPLWTIREIIAHLSGWDDSAIGFLNALLKGELPPTPAMRGTTVYNDETVSTREGLNYDQILREYMSTRSNLLSLIRKTPDEILTKKSILPWGEEGSFVDLANIFTPHEIEHAEDVKKLIEEEKQKLGNK